MPQSFLSAVFKTIIYADIFNYPLKREEIEKWLIKFKIQKSKFKNTIKKSKIIHIKDGYYFIRGRENIIQQRKEKERYSKEKYKIVNKITGIIKLIPSVKLVGITGNLAVNNADKNDDIDLLVITKKNLLWTTRLLVTILVELFGRRRRPDDTDITDKICLNMYVSEDYLSVPVNERDLYSAHEVLQMKPLYERDNIYNKFITTNKWVKEYLPNAMGIINYESGIRNNNKNNSLLHFLIVKLLNIIEYLLEKFQLAYMKKRRTRETIGEGVIRFHSLDTHKRILREYKHRINKYSITNDI